MTDKEINIAIAEACPGLFRKWVGAWQIHNDDGWLDLLNGSICSDLNAMHEAEKVLSSGQIVEYQRMLHSNTSTEWGQTHATARQRAESFLRTIGKWEEQ